MATKTLAVFGLTLNIEETTIESGHQVLDKLREEKETPFNCIQALAQQLKLTSAEATAIYADWMNKNKPIF